ncbi:MAG TPA: class I SAM-dependent methyltransferase [Pseudonocardiaceae bacterium]|jgi:hypothetical protein|nr:class I SAM-dependent methyltransferase [Pseudonocardiaceae bacterium]
MTCRWCVSEDGEFVLDLGEQPASDAFPSISDPGPDPRYPLRMWLCARCGLAQLVEDPTTPEEPRGVEPAALVAQAADAVSRVAAAGVLPAGASVLEYGSPHGGSWLPMLTRRGLRPAEAAERADVVLDCFGMMHWADQRVALRTRLERLADNGVLLLQYHSLAAIIHDGQWNALRHGHFAYYSTRSLHAMLAEVGLVPRFAWEFSLYGGTVLLAATRGGQIHSSVWELLSRETMAGTRDPRVVSGLQSQVSVASTALREWLEAAAQAGKRVIGYGAASRAVALLCRAGVDVELLPAVADASPAKAGRRMPGTRIPVIPAGELVAARPDVVLVFVPDILGEVRGRFPELAGVEWAVAEPTPRVLP